MARKRFVARDAKGEVGLLMRLVRIEDAEAGIDRVVIRQYFDEKDARGHKKFKDYLVTHYDLRIQILDEGAVIWDGETREGFDGYIDYKGLPAPESRKKK